ncbi:MAG: OmpH family outer membrane protein [Muribaculaceae bacterium]|nr:OmpH family outer membrane protein [Muribaculaceae bacterium]
MKKSSIIAGSILMVALSGMVSCSQSTETTNGAAGTASAAEGAKTTANLPNIRYIDSDSVSAHYELAKEVQDAALKAMTRIENARQSKANEIQKFASQIEEKARTNGYLTQESYNGDMARLQKMQQEAENYMINLQRNIETELAQQQQVLSDSLESFIKVYNAEKGYDAILFRAAGIYFNPALDITEEVTKELNARYVKKEESK